MVVVLVMAATWNRASYIVTIVMIVLTDPPLSERRSNVVVVATAASGGCVGAVEAVPVDPFYVGLGIVPVLTAGRRSAGTVAAAIFRRRRRIVVVFVTSGGAVVVVVVVVIILDVMIVIVIFIRSHPLSSLEARRQARLMTIAGSCYVRCCFCYWWYVDFMMILYACIVGVVGVFVIVPLVDRCFGPGFVAAIPLIIILRSTRDCRGEKKN
jgi:hypothetical protein